MSRLICPDCSQQINITLADDFYKTYPLYGMDDGVLSSSAVNVVCPRCGKVLFIQVFAHNEQIDVEYELNVAISTKDSINKNDWRKYVTE